MKCPRCESALIELDRDGVTVDRCERCRGIWLDRGELEKLQAKASPTRGRSEHNNDDDPDDDDRQGGRGGRQRSWWEIFD